MTNEQTIAQLLTALEAWQAATYRTHEEAQIRFLEIELIEQALWELGYEF